MTITMNKSDGMFRTCSLNGNITPTDPVHCTHGTGLCKQVAQKKKSIEIRTTETLNKRLNKMEFKNKKEILHDNSAYLQSIHI